VPAQSGFASLMTGSEYGVAHLPTRPEEKAETAVSVSTECIEFRGKRKCRRAIVRIAGDSKAQEAQLPLLQFAFRPLKRFNHHEHRWARHCADYLCIVQFVSRIRGREGAQAHIDLIKGSARVTGDS